MVKFLVVVFALGAGACSRNRTREAQAFAADLAALDEAAEKAVKTSPDEHGLAAAESLVASKNVPLHAQMLVLHDAADPSVSQTIAHACDFRSAPENVRDYVYNAVLRTNPPLRARAKKLGATLCEICETPTNATRCATLRDPMNSD